MPTRKTLLCEKQRQLIIEKNKISITLFIITTDYKGTKLFMKYNQRMWKKHESPKAIQIVIIFFEKNITQLDYKGQYSFIKDNKN